MELLIFCLVFIIANIILLKWADKVLNDFPQRYYKPSNIGGREIIGNSELEKIRETVNSKKADFRR